MRKIIEMELDVDKVIANWRSIYWDSEQLNIHTQVHCGWFIPFSASVVV